MVPRVSIVIPTYNRAHVLPRAIDSVLSQTYPNLELLIVDDGSTDNTQQVLEKYIVDRQVKVLKHEKNRGVTAAKNTGLDNLGPDTKYFSLLDSDDVLRPEAVALLVDVFENLGNTVSQVFGWCADMHTGVMTGQFAGSGSYVNFEDALCCRFSGEFWQIVSMDFLEGRRFDERAAGGEGTLWYALLRRAPGYVVPEVVRYYDRSGKDRVSLDSYDSETSKRKMWAYLACWNMYHEDLLRHCPLQFALIGLEAAKWASLAGNRKTSIKLLYETAAHAPMTRWINILMQTL
ncbi:MAG: glycosyltransferase family 2 protein, partial [Nitrospirae bacterium]|nr:glycosyltransferase family 2 protein [Nitrospirota bacterium]